MTEEPEWISFYFSVLVWKWHDEKSRITRPLTNLAFFRALLSASPPEPPGQRWAAFELQVVRNGILKRRSALAKESHGLPLKNISFSFLCFFLYMYCESWVFIAYTWVCGCTFPHMCIQRPEEDVWCLPQQVFALFLWDRVSHWTRNSPFLLGLPDSKLSGPPCLQRWHYRCTQLGSTFYLGAERFGLKPPWIHSKSSCLLNYLPSTSP